MQVEAQVARSDPRPTDAEAHDIDLPPRAQASRSGRRFVLCVHPRVRVQAQRPQLQRAQPQRGQVTVRSEGDPIGEGSFRVQLEVAAPGDAGPVRQPGPSTIEVDCHVALDAARLTVAGDGHRCALRPQRDRPRYRPAITFDGGGDTRRLDRDAGQLGGENVEDERGARAGRGDDPSTLGPEPKARSIRTVPPAGCGRGRCRRVTAPAGRHPGCWRPGRP